MKTFYEILEENIYYEKPNIEELCDIIQTEVNSWDEPEPLPGWFWEIRDKAKTMTTYEAVQAAMMLDDYFGLGLFEDDDDEMDVPDYLVGDEYEDVEEVYPEEQAVVASGMNEDAGKTLTQKERRMRALKKKKKRILGKKTETLNFKRNYYFDRKKRKFVKRDKALDVQTLRKKTKRFKRVLRKASTKRKIQRSKRRFKNQPTPKV